MIGSLFFRLLSVAAPSVASVVMFDTAEQPQVPSQATLLEIRADAPVAQSRGWFDRERTASVPLTVTAKAPSGEEHELKISLPLKQDLVQSVRDGFQERATVVLRKVESALLEGIKAEDHEVRQASLDILPLVQEAVPYQVNPGIEVSSRVEKAVAYIAEKTYQQTGKRIVVTSATRTPMSQADAMRIKLDLGESPRRLYANKAAAGEIENAYYWAKKIGLDQAGVTQTMASVIERQVEQGIYLSRHMREGAVDIRSRDLSAAEKSAVRRAAQELGARVALETTPPHFHLELF